VSWGGIRVQGRQHAIVLFRRADGDAQCVVQLGRGALVAHHHAGGEQCTESAIRIIEAHQQIVSLRRIDAAYAGYPRERVVYTGSLTGTRSARHLLQALEWCRERNPDSLADLDVILAGSVDRAEQRILDATSLRCVTHRGHIPFAEAAELQRSADLLLVIDSPLRAEDSVFFPSKLLDYLAAGRPIVAITSPGSMTREVLADDGRSFDHGDAAGLGAYLMEVLNAHRQRSGTRAPARPPSDRFSARTNAAQLAELLRAVTRTPRPAQVA